MDRDVNYVVVGAFVVLVIVMASAFLYWYSGEREHRSYKRYEIYFRGTVSGLSNGASVRYLGVDVGKVVRVRLDPLERKRVQVIVDIDQTAPIDGATTASLNLQGITGLLYIDLKQDPKIAAATPLQQGRQYPMIHSTPSDLDVFFGSLPTFATRAAELADRLNRIVSDDNIRAFTGTLASVHAAGERLPPTMLEVQRLVGDLRGASQEVGATAADLRAVLEKSGPNLEATIANFRHISERLSDTSDHLDRFMADSEPYLTRFAREGLPELEQLLRESRDAAHEIRDLSLSLEREPTRLLYESSYPGVELPH